MQMCTEWQEKEESPKIVVTNKQTDVTGRNLVW
jgi:hypothetical protein